MAKILIVEDDKNLSDLVKIELEHENFDTLLAYDGRECLNILEKQSVDLILLDIMLPQINGLEVLRKIRTKSSIPIILVTARGETLDKVNGLNSGADDYIAKPFKIEELLARINAVLRRTINTQDNILYNGSIEMHIDKMKVLFNSQEVTLSKNEFFLLKFFLQNIDKVLSRNHIIENVWGKNIYIEENSVDVYVTHLRKYFSKDIITSIRGIGYKMKKIKSRETK